MTVPLVDHVRPLNDEIAALNRNEFERTCVFAVNLIGATGCGKTALLEATLKRFRNELEIGVLAGDLATTRDAERLTRWCDHVVQINTGPEGRLDANHVRQAIRTLDLGRLDLLIIENIGNLTTTVELDLGQTAIVGMFSTTEGDDKPAKHPQLVRKADLLLLNKIDLLPYVPFDLPRFSADVRQINPQAELLETSATTGQVERWNRWLLGHTARLAPDTDTAP